MRSATAVHPIELHNATKWYGDVIGVNQVTLELTDGITGILGPNGAGKSTLLKLVTGRLRPNRGYVRVMGFDPWKQPTVYHHLGYCSDTDSFYEDMNAQELIVLMGQLSGFPRAESTRRAKRYIELLAMTEFADRRIREYSKGMRQRVKLAAALVHEPQILVLDEPLNGLDPVGRKLVLDLLRTLGAEGRTVLISSHILHEVEALTNRIALMHRGRVLAEGQIEDIRALIENQPLTFRIVSPHRRRIAAELVELDSVCSLELPPEEPSVLLVRTTKPPTLYETLQQGVIERHYSVMEFTATDENLDAIFQYLVKE